MSVSAELKASRFSEFTVAYFSNLQTKCHEESLLSGGRFLMGLWATPIMRPGILLWLKESMK